MLTWIMFLKFLDDMERAGEEEALLSGERYRPALEPPYRWRDWAANGDGITGEALIAFVNNDEAVRPDGTRGFLVEAYRFLEQQCRTVEERRTLQQASIAGGEAKSLPYLLAQMNLLLHGLEAPRIDPGNSLRFNLREIGDRERVDVILTN